MSAPAAIEIWTCIEKGCSYWREEKSTGVHMATNPDDQNGALRRHQLEKSVYRFDTP